MAKDPILLDTCAWIWLMEGHDRLVKSSALREIEKAASSGFLFLCPISVWEVCTKASRGNLRFSMPIYDWIRIGKDKSGIQNTVLSDDIMYQSTILPGVFHQDPADRLIVATAIKDGLRLATGDTKILTWAEANLLKVISI